MPRRPRFCSGGYVFHVLNRAVGRQVIFPREGDYAALERVLEEDRREPWVGGSEVVEETPGGAKERGWGVARC